MGVWGSPEGTPTVQTNHHQPHPRLADLMMQFATRGPGFDRYTSDEDFLSRVWVPVLLHKPPAWDPRQRRSCRDLKSRLRLLPSHPHRQPLGRRRTEYRQFMAYPLSKTRNLSLTMDERLVL